MLRVQLHPASLNQPAHLPDKNERLKNSQRYNTPGKTRHPYTATTQHRLQPQQVHVLSSIAQTVCNNTQHTQGRQKNPACTTTPCSLLAPALCILMYSLTGIRDLLPAAFCSKQQAAPAPAVRARVAAAHNTQPAMSVTMHLCSRPYRNMTPLSQPCRLHCHTVQRCKNYPAAKQ